MSGKASALHWAWPAIGWLLGLACLQHCERLPRSREYAGLLLLLLLLLALCLLLAWRRRPLPPRSPTLTLSLSLTLTLTLAALLLAFTVGAGRAALRLADALPQAWEGRDLLLEGRVDSLPVATLGQGGAPGWRFEFECQRSHAGPSPDDPPLVLPHRLLLSWYGLPFEAAPPLRAGERWRFVLRLKRPNGLMNPHAFDYEAWLLEQDLRATGLVRPGSAQRLAAAPWWSLDAARQRLREALQRRIADPTVAGVLAALSLGDQAAIGREDWALFRDTSVAHLLSVSGLHVTMFAWLAAAACGALWRRSARLCLYLPAPRLALWAGVAAALAYALFSGWGVPAQRTVWMLASLALLRSLGLRWPWPLSLLAAAVVVTAIDPWAIGQAGFWLSFAAVALLMASGSPPRREAGGPGRWRALLRQGLHSQWVASLGLAPLSLLFFQQISLLGLVANLVAIPLVSFVITPLAFLGIAAPPLWDGAELCVRALMAWLRWLDGWGWAVWRVPVAPPWAQAAGLLGGALLVLPLPARLRLCGAGLLLPLLWPAPPRPAAGEFELLAADVGQGSAVLLRTAGHDLLYDSGPAYAPGVDAGQRVLLPLLRALGVQRLDLLMLSHRDSDHVGGALSLLRGMPVLGLSSSLEPGHPLLLAGPPAQSHCQAGQRWAWDGVQFELLHPAPADYGRALKSNAMSCVLRIRAASGRTALLMGDLEAAQELTLVRDTRADALRADLLLVPHHGSKTSSSAALLDAVAPRYAVVQAGYRNRFGHPAPPVLARYQARGIRTFIAPDCGAWRWWSVDDRWQCQRQQAPRYWQRPPGQADAAALVGPQQDGGEPGPLF